MVSPLNRAWSVLKALPEQQLITESTRNISPIIDETSQRLGTIHPAIQGILERQGRGGPEGFTTPNLQSLDYMGKPSKDTDILNQPFHYGSGGQANWRYPPSEEGDLDWKEKRNRARLKHIYRDVNNPQYDPDEADWLDTEDELGLLDYDKEEEEDSQYGYKIEGPEGHENPIIPADKDGELDIEQFLQHLETGKVRLTEEHWNIVFDTMPPGFSRAALSGYLGPDARRAFMNRVRDNYFKRTQDS